VQRTDFDRFRNVDLLLSLLYCRSGDYRSALEALSAYLSTNPNINNMSYYAAVAAFLRLRAGGRTHREAQRELETVFGTDVAGEVGADLADPADTFQDWALPRCGNCASCPIVDDCAYAQWRDLSQSIVDKMDRTPVDQKSLAWVISGSGKRDQG
jgi:hypothetical protein